MTVGILALQGDFREHEEMLRRIGAPTLQVRLPKHLQHVERLIIPGGVGLPLTLRRAAAACLSSLLAQIKCKCKTFPRTSVLLETPRKV
jgi:5'-phosphate synthase pdxT subunit